MITIWTKFLAELSPYVDIFVLISILFGFFWGVYRGLVRMVFSFLAWGLALGTVMVMSPFLRDQLQALLNQPVPLWAVALVGFVFVKILTHLMGEWIHRSLNQAGFGLSNRLMGGGLGVVQVAVMAVGVWYLLWMLQMNQVWQDTYLNRCLDWFFAHQLNKP